MTRKKKKHLHSKQDKSHKAICATLRHLCFLQNAHQDAITAESIKALSGIISRQITPEMLADPLVQCELIATGKPSFIKKVMVAQNEAANLLAPSSEQWKRILVNVHHETIVMMIQEKVLSPKNGMLALLGYCAQYSPDTMALVDIFARNCPYGFNLLKPKHHAFLANAKVRAYASYFLQVNAGFFGVHYRDYAKDQAAERDIFTLLVFQKIGISMDSMKAYGNKFHRNIRSAMQKLETGHAQMALFKLAPDLFTTLKNRQKIIALYEPLLDIPK